jgi:hypothetical protein
MYEEKYSNDAFSFETADNALENCRCSEQCLESLHTFLSCRNAMFACRFSIGKMSAANGSNDLRREKPVAKTSAILALYG